MQKVKRTLFFPAIFVSCFFLSLVWGQSPKELKRIVKNAQKDESATYQIETKSPFGKNKVTMITRVVTVGITSLKVKKILKWKGRNYIKTSKFSLSRDFVDQLQRELESGWSSIQIDKKVETVPSTISLNTEVGVKTRTIKQSGANTIQKDSTSTRSDFSCYKLTFKVKGKYPKKNAHSATMTMTYWISPKVPVFGLVKAEGTIVQKIQNVEIKSTIKITLKKYHEILLLK